MMNPVVHFEMPYNDRIRMVKFYESVFGWKTQMLGEDMGNYVLATTTETGESGPQQPGAINGGFFPKTRIGQRNIPLSLSRLRISKNR
ncbi:MAG: VOC family protein [Dissulfurispiraceae bacterium]